MDEELFGLDAGNSYCTVSHFGRYGLDIVGKCPSVVFIREDRIDVGEQAAKSGSRNPKQFVFDLQFMLGASLTDQNIQQRRNQWPFEVAATEDGRIGVVVRFGENQKVYPVYYLWGLVLKEAVKIANRHLGTEIDRVVLSHPWYYQAKYPDETKDALEVAGLTCTCFMDSFTAATRAYFYRTVVVDKAVPARRILVCDIGSMQVSLASMELSGNVYAFKEKPVSYLLGGQYFDEILIEKFEKKYNSVELNERAKFKLRISCEKAKCLLSSCESTEIYIEIGDDEISMPISRKEFEEQVYPMIRGCIHEYKSRLKNKKFDEILCVGGGCNIPIVQSYLRQSLKCEVYQSLTCQEVIARGLLSPNKEVDKRRFCACPGIECSIEGTSYSISLERGDRLPCQRLGCWDVDPRVCQDCQICLKVRSLEGMPLVEHKVCVPEAILRTMEESRWQLHVTVTFDEEGRLGVTPAWYLREDSTTYEIADEFDSTKRASKRDGRQKARGDVSHNRQENDLRPADHETEEHTTHVPKQYGPDEQGMNQDDIGTDTLTATTNISATGTATTDIGATRTVTTNTGATRTATTDIGATRTVTTSTHTGRCAEDTTSVRGQGRHKRGYGK